MIRGLYISASSAIAESKRMDVIANNIANINTTGYKKDILVTESFPDILISKIGGGPDGDVVKNKLGGDSVTSVNDGDLYTAESSTGFFNVQTPLGMSKNRSIQFKVNEAGYLVTPQGNYIMGLKGPINTGGAPVTVDSKGQILAGGAVVDSLKMTNPINTIGNLSYGVNVHEIKTDFDQGQLTPTENSFDLAIQGKGFFTVETPEGERYTRDGEFTRNAEGYLVTKEGYKVLGKNGPILIEGKDLSINEKGEITSGGKSVDRLKLIDFKDYGALRKEGNGLLSAVAEGRPDNGAEFTGTVQQGFIESSNVNSVKEMVDMITVLRSYEANQKIIKTHDELLGKSVNEIGRV